MSLSKFSNVKISGMVCVVPERNINIDDELEFYDNNLKKLERNKKILGLGVRHIVPEGVTASDLCEEAAKVLIEKMSINKNEIDTLIMVSINHDYIGNSDACIIQGHLGLSEECACFDMSGLGCTDAVYGLWVAHSLIASGASKKCLLLEGSTSSLITDVKNRNSNMLFGDAGSAILLEKSDGEKSAYFHLMSRGKDWKKIATPAGGFRLPVREDIVNLEVTDPEGNPLRLWDSAMRGTDVFRFAVETAPLTINKVLEFAQKTKEDIDFFAIHQANGQIVKTVVNHSGLPPEKTSFETFSKYGNCGGTSVLVNFCDQMYGKKYQDIALISFGVGLSTASCVLNLADTYNGGVQFFKTPEKILSREEMINDWIAYLHNPDIA